MRSQFLLNCSFARQTLLRRKSVGRTPQLLRSEPLIFLLRRQCNAPGQSEIDLNAKYFRPVELEAGAAASSV